MRWLLSQKLVLRIEQSTPSQELTLCNVIKLRHGALKFRFFLEGSFRRIGQFLCENAENIKLYLDMLAASLSPGIQFTHCLQGLNSSVSSAQSFYNTMIFL